ncbi:MAG: hypothetical protein QMC67_15330 [Candidatus Wallbacteria bacterium]
MSGINRLDYSGYDTMISYTGHGMIEKHPANLTIAGVMTHELGHLNEARLDSVMTGDEIVSQNIDLNLQYVDGRLIATGGLATTVTRKNADKLLNKYQKYNSENLAKNNQPSNSDYKTSNLNNLTSGPEVTKSERQKLDEAAFQMQQYKIKLESEIRRLEKINSEYLSVPAAGAEFNQPVVNDIAVNEADGSEKKGTETIKLSSGVKNLKLENLKKQLAKIENMINTINMAKTGETFKKLIKAVAQANFGIAFDMAGTAVKGKIASPDNGNNSVTLVQDNKNSASTNIFPQDDNSKTNFLDDSKRNNGANNVSQIESMVSLIEQSISGALLDVKV